MAPDFEQQSHRMREEEKDWNLKGQGKRGSRRKEKEREQEGGGEKGILLSMVPGILHIVSHFTKVKTEVPTD